MKVIENVNPLEVVWVAIAVFGLVYGIRLHSDAIKDVAARKLTGINSGREDLALLLVTTASLLSFALFIFLLCGIGAMLVPTPASTSPIAYVIQVGLISAEMAISYTLYIKQKVRRRVLLRDMANEEIRVAAAALAARHLDANTNALAANTIATEAATDAMQGGAMQNGAIAAQVAQTEATAELTTATTENSDVIRISTEVELRKLDGADE